MDENKQKLHLYAAVNRGGLTTTTAAADAAAATAAQSSSIKINLQGHKQGSRSEQSDGQ